MLKHETDLAERLVVPIIVLAYLPRNVFFIYRERFIEIAIYLFILHIAPCKGTPAV